MIDPDDSELLARSLARATESSTGVGLDAALDEIGWRDALELDPRTAVSLLFELQGRANATSSALGSVVAHALGADRGSAVVLPPIGTTDAPGRPGSDGLGVRGLATRSLLDASTALVVSGGDDGPECHTVAIAQLVTRRIHGLDPGLGLVAVAATGLSTKHAPTPAPVWPDALATGQLAMAHELVGASRAMLRLARDHAVERIQFGRPIAGFQAVRHRLADAHVAVEAADSSIAAAWEEGTPIAAAMAKAIAGRSARLVAEHAQQVLAGIGFTAEHDLHRHLRRVLALDGLLGDARSLTRTIGVELLRSRRLPAMLPL